MSDFETKVGKDWLYAVDFADPQSTADGYVRPFRCKAIESRKKIVGNMYDARLRFTFKGDRDNRVFGVLLEEPNEAGESWTIQRSWQAKDAETACDYMKEDQIAGRMAVSLFVEVEEDFTRYLPLGFSTAYNALLAI